MTATSLSRFVPAILALTLLGRANAQITDPGTGRDPANPAPRLGIVLNVTPAEPNAPVHNPAELKLDATVISTTGLPTRLEVVADSVVVAQLQPEIPIELAFIPPGTPVAYHGSWTALAPGNYSLFARTATDWGAPAASDPIPVTVGSNPARSSGATLNFDSPSDNSRFTTPTGIPLIVSATDPKGSIRHLQIHADNRLIAVSHILTKDADIPGRPRVHRALWQNPPPGTHLLTAWAVDADGLPVSTPPLSIEVTVAPPTPTLRILSIRPGQILRSGASIPVEAVGLGRFGGITHVEAWLDGQKTTESQIVFIRPPEADEPVYHSMELANVPPGRHRIEVRDATDSSVTSGTIEFTVQGGAQLRIASPSDGSVHRPSAPIELIAEGTGVDGGITRIEFLVDGQKVGESSIQFIVAPSADAIVRHTFTLPSLAASRHDIVARSLEPEGTASQPVSIQVAEIGITPVETDPALGLRTLKDGTLCLVVKETPGASGRIAIEASDDLHSWETVALLDDPAAAITETPARSTAPPRRFFRAIRRP